MRGDIYRLRRDKTATGHEQGGPHIAVEVQSDLIRLSTLIVAPTSTRAQPATFRPSVDLLGTTTRILVDQVRAVDLSRLGDHVGRLDTGELADLNRSVRLMMGVL